jgi:hypothetical protein
MVVYAKPNHILSVTFTTRRSYKGAVILRSRTSNYDPFDLPQHQLRNLIRGIIWRDEHFAGSSLRSIADRNNVSEAGVRKIVMASFETLLNF